MLKVDFKFVGAEELKRDIKNLEKQARFAMVKAINATAKKIVVAEREHIARIFDRPRPVTLNSVRVKKFANYKEDHIEAIVQIDDGVSSTAAEAMFQANVDRQGKSSIPPSKYLLAQMVGGRRAVKRFERALIHAGLMPAGMAAVFAKRSGYLDMYGNMPGPKIVQILSYFQAFPEQGYRMNMKARSKQNLLAGKRKGMKWGMAYFRGGRDTGLPDGIWERHYPSGPSGKSFIKPVLIYVRAATYRKRFEFDRVAMETVDQVWNAEWEAAISYALRTAR